LKNLGESADVTLKTSARWQSCCDAVAGEPEPPAAVTKPDIHVVSVGRKEFVASERARGFIQMPGKPVDPLPDTISIAEYDPRWPELFRREADRIRTALGDRALRIEHTGSTSVSGLVAKPIVDILLVVADSADESTYVPELEAAGYSLRFREPDWYEHRLFRGPDIEINLHILSARCPEIDRILLFRDQLHASTADRDLYARTKLALARQQWDQVQNYADAKTAVIEEILSRAGTQ
jgi:GrpB-like predicted nucleotidyltransferase (UPF0157 family)